MYANDLARYGLSGRVRVTREDYELGRPGVGGDVGYDLPVLVRPYRQSWFDRLWSWLVREPVYVIWPGQTRSLPSGIALALPEGIWARIDARSSARNRRLDVAGGRIIDTGYRGALVSVVRNIGWRPRVVLHGERIAQVTFQWAVLPELLSVPFFSDETERGPRGFGSTGR